MSVNNKRILARERVVKILKVHGSLDWFKHIETGKITGFPMRENIPPSYDALIIPPGNDKYSMTHEEPYRTIIEEADKEFENAGSYLCVGYGFNDDHIQPKLITQITNGKPIVVVTKKASDQCFKLITKNNNINYLIIQENKNQTEVTFNDNDTQHKVFFLKENIWNFDEFIDLW